MKRLAYLIFPAVLLASCGNAEKKKGNTEEELNKLKTERSALDEKIRKLEGNKVDTVSKPVSVTELSPVDFNAYVEVQSQILGDENVLAVPRMQGTVTQVLVHPGQKVSKGQLLGTIDDAIVSQQMEQLKPSLSLQKTLVEKQEKLWQQNIGTEVQLMSTKAQYEATLKQLEVLKAQRDLYKIVAPISGTVDYVDLKVGDAIGMPGAAGIRIVNNDKLKAEASLGENYLGKVKAGDPTYLVFPDMNDSIKTSLTYVSQVVNPVSRAFTVQVRLGNNSRLHPNMACKMKIANYENPHALVVPVSVIQRTPEGEMLYIADGNVAKSVHVTIGRNSNGQVEVLSGLKPGDRVITKGFEELDNGQKISLQ